MKSGTTLLVCLLAVSGLSLNAQTADEIIAKHVAAIGGKEKLAQVSSIYIESATEAMGNEAPTKTYIVNGKNYRNESDFGGQTIVQVVSDKSGWAIMPFGGSPDPAVMSDDDFKAGADQIYVGDPLASYSATGGKVELLGQEKINTVNAYKIKYTNKFGVETTYYIDPSTHYIIESIRQANMMGQPVTVTTTYSNYQKTDYGVTMPGSLNLDMGQFQLAITIQKTVINQPVDATTFDMPK